MLSRMAHGGNEHEEIVAQEMLDKLAGRFGMTGEEAQAELLIFSHLTSQSQVISR